MFRFSSSVDSGWAGTARLYVITLLTVLAVWAATAAVTNWGALSATARTVIIVVAVVFGRVAWELIERRVKSSDTNPANHIARIAATNGIILINSTSGNLATAAACVVIIAIPTHAGASTDQGSATTAVMVSHAIS